MVKVITVATDKRFYYPYLEATCRMFGGELVCLGSGETWGGYTWKFIKVIEYLSAIDPTEFVIFVDGYDVICVQDLSTITDKYRAIQSATRCKLIVATAVYTKIPRIITDFHFGTKNGMAINSGTYMGFAGDILDILTKAVARYPTEIDDQILITNYAKNNGKDILIDGDQTFFYAVGNPFCETSVPKNKHPYFVHAFGCTLLTNILNDMGFVVDGNINIELRSLFIQKSIYHSLELLKRNAIIILLIIATILFIINARRRNT